MAKTASTNKTYRNGLEHAAAVLLARASVYREEAPIVGAGRIEKAEILEALAAEICAQVIDPESTGGV